MNVVAFADSDYAGYDTSRRSTSGYCVMVGSNPVIWRSKKHDVVSRSSAEAEYRSMAHATQELVWVRNLLTELQFHVRTLMTLYCDNNAAIHIANNPVFHERTKHIEIDCHFVREKVQDGSIITPYIASEHQPADVFTKAIGSIQFEKLLSKLGVCNLYDPA